MNAVKAFVMAAALLVILGIPAVALKLSVEGLILVACLIALCGVMVELTEIRKRLTR